MAYFNLRKRAAEADPDEAVEEELAEDEAAEDDEEDGPVGLGSAVWAGISGPGRWLAERGRVDVAWCLYAGSMWAPFYYGGWVALGVPMAWLAMVLLFLPSDFKERVAARVEGWSEARGKALDEAATDTAADSGQSRPADPRTVLIGWLDELTRGRSGIHLDELHQALTAHPQLAALTRPEMRAWLARHDIPVERTLRVGKQAGRSGVSRSTVEALLKARPPLPESDPAEVSVHASDVHDSPMESGVERGGEHAA